MSIFKKKETTPEKELVDEIWQEINLALAIDKERSKLHKIVKNAYKNGASCDEIRRVYWENLPIYRQKSDAVYPGLKEVLVDGLSFQLPHRYHDFRGSIDSAEYTCNQYAHLLMGDDGVEVVSNFDIYVFKGLTTDQALSTLTLDKKMEIDRGITYGAYTGIAVSKTGLRNSKRLEWFIFEKEGKTVAIHCTSSWDFKVYLEKIANGWTGY